MTSSNDNEKIVVHDASILLSNEHPKFKIGDVINNGHGDFIVKGFTRSFMGLAYVLDNGRKLICWLTEQADAKCHLAELNKKKENNGTEWVSTKIKFPEAGEQVLTACKNKNKEDGIWLYDLCYYYPNTGWEDRVNWEDVLYWTYIDEPKEN